MAAHNRTEVLVGVTDSEVEQIRDRQTRLEAAVSTLSETTKQVVEMQRLQQDALNTLAGNVQTIATSLKSREGRVDLRMVLTVIVPLCGFVAFFMAMYLAPLKNQVDNNSIMMQMQVSDIRKNIEHMETSGTTSGQIHQAVTDERISYLRRDVTRLEDEQKDIRDAATHKRSRK